MGNKSFKEKKKILIDNNIKLDSVIQRSDKWTRSEIEERSEAIAEISYQEVWKF